METVEQPTCGKGLAENSILPRSLGKLISAMAENLSVHTKALELTDSNARLEQDAYERLIGQLRQAAAELQLTASEMAGYRDLPMGKHDETAMTQPAVLTAFEEFVRQKQELVSLLQRSAGRDEQLLKVMRKHIPR